MKEAVIILIIIFGFVALNLIPVHKQSSGTSYSPTTFAADANIQPTASEVPSPYPTQSLTTTLANLNAPLQMIGFTQVPGDSKHRTVLAITFNSSENHQLSGFVNFASQQGGPYPFTGEIYGINVNFTAENLPGDGQLDFEGTITSGSHPELGDIGGTVTMSQRISNEQYYPTKLPNGSDAPILYWQASLSR